MTGKTKKTKGDFYRYLGIASTVGINIVVSTVIGFAIGYFVLDKIFHTFPLFTIIFLILGIFAGFKYLFKVASKISNNVSEKNNDS
jgi:F0F1-type ATP synthase assembly protein I